MKSLASWNVQSLETLSKPKHGDLLTNVANGQKSKSQACKDGRK